MSPSQLLGFSQVFHHRDSCIVPGTLQMHHSSYLWSNNYSGNCFNPISPTEQYIPIVRRLPCFPSHSQCQEWCWCLFLMALTNPSVDLRLSGQFQDYNRCSVNTCWIDYEIVLGKSLLFSLQLPYLLKKRYSLSPSSSNINSWKCWVYL